MGPIQRKNVASAQEYGDLKVWVSDLVGVELLDDVTACDEQLSLARIYKSKASVGNYIDGLEIRRTREEKGAAITEDFSLDDESLLKIDCRIQACQRVEFGRKWKDKV